MKFELDEKKIESICYKGKCGKKFIIFLEDGVMTDIIYTGIADVGVSAEDLSVERGEILKRIKNLNPDEWFDKNSGTNLTASTTYNKATTTKEDFHNKATTTKEDLDCNYYRNERE
jgi:hypothetical protein